MSPVTRSRTRRRKELVAARRKELVARSKELVARTKELDARRKEIVSRRKDLVTKISIFKRKNNELHLDPIKIRIVLQLYKDWRSCFLTARKNAFARGVLYYIAERMYWSRFTGSREVVTLLQFILETGVNLREIMITSLRPFRSVTDELKPDFILYFLNHAYQQHAIFDGFRKTVTEVLYKLTGWWSIAVTLCMPCPSFIHEILRYGGTIHYDYGEYPVTEYRQRTNRRDHIFEVEHALEWTVKSILNLNPNLVRLEELAYFPKDLESYHKLLTCCSLLMKELPQMDVKYFSRLYSNPEIMCHMDGHDFARKLGENVLEGFEKHFTTPLDLKHHCRLKIRSILNTNYRLPRGIYGLQVPTSLHRYLDLY